MEPQNGGGRAGLGQRVTWDALITGTLWPGLGQGAADLSAGRTDQKEWAGIAPQLGNRAVGPTIGYQRKGELSADVFAYFNNQLA